MRKEFIDYIENLKEVNKYKDEYLIIDGDDNEIIEKFHTITKNQRLCFERNNQILDKILYNRILNNDDLSKEEINEYQEFASNLFTHQIQLDVAIAYEIHSWLLDLAIKRQDHDLIIEESYFKGLAIYYIYLNDITLDECEETFYTPFNYTKEEYFKLSKKARNYFNRSMGNYLMCLSRTKNTQLDVDKLISQYERVIEFQSDKEVRALDPDINWDLFIYTEKTNFTSVLTPLKNDLYTDDTRLIDQLYTYIKDCYDEGVEKINLTVTPSSSVMLYRYYSAQYYKKIITLEELCDKLEKLSTPNLNDPLNYDSIQRIFQNSANLILYLHKLKKQGYEVNERITNVLNEMDYHISELSPSDHTKLFFSTMDLYIQISFMTLPEDQLYDRILHTTVYQSFQLFIHINMLKVICCDLCQYLIVKHPEYFLSLPNIDSIDKVLEMEQEIISMIEKFIILHDVGSVQMLSIITNFGRNLTNLERTILTNHPIDSFKMMISAPIDENIKKMTIAHHRSYDNKSGYPSLEVIKKYCSTDQQPYRILLDIFHVASTLEAATDTVLRPYRTPKDIDTILDEMRTKRGTEYSPLVLDLFNDKTLKQIITNLLSKVRKEIIVDTVKHYRKIQNNSF